jgi:hypothetical protein
MNMRKDVLKERMLFLFSLLLGVNSIVSAGCTAGNDFVLAEVEVDDKDKGNFPYDRVAQMVGVASGAENSAHVWTVTDGVSVRDELKDDGRLLVRLTFQEDTAGEINYTLSFLDDQDANIGLSRQMFRLPEAYRTSVKFAIRLTAPMCQDTLKNGTETDVDCGGGQCGFCAKGKVCVTHADCGTAYCDPQKVCADRPAACMDRTKNGTETDVDCGGNECLRCGDGKACSIDDDCASGFCANGQCTKRPMPDLSMTATDGGSPMDDMAVGPVTPRIDQVTPSNGPTTGGTVLDITGQNFENGATVTVGGKSATNVMVVSSTLIKATTPASPGTFGFVPVIVSNPNRATDEEWLFSYVLSSLAFGPVKTETVGPKPTHVLLIDLNGDERADIITANSAASDISVALGNGDGTFRQSVAVSVGTSPRETAAGDVNVDGRVDLLTANSGADTVSVLLGKGDGTFQAPVSYPVGSKPFSVTVGDFNGDKKTDLAAANFITGNVTIYIGKGDGTFEGRDDIVVARNLKRLIARDLNGDGKDDLVTTSELENAVVVLLGNGNGTFQVPKSFAVDVGPDTVDAADSDGDGKVDLIVACDGAGVLSSLKGKGDGTFHPRVTLAAGNKAQAATWADMDGDGLPEVVAANYGGDDVSVLRNIGGTISTMNPLRLVAGGLAPFSVRVADLNGDGRPDVVAALFNSSAVSVWLNTSQ